MVSKGSANLWSFANVGMIHLTLPMAKELDLPVCEASSYGGGSNPCMEALTGIQTEVHAQVPQHGFDVVL